MELTGAIRSRLVSSRSSERLSQNERWRVRKEGTGEPHTHQPVSQSSKEKEKEGKGKDRKKKEPSGHQDALLPPADESTVKDRGGRRNAFRISEAFI